MSDSHSLQATEDHLEELAAGYVLNALSPQETAEFESHLTTHPDLAEHVQALQEVMGLMAHASGIPAPDQLRAKILAIPQTSLSSSLAEQPKPAAKSRSTPGIVSFNRLPWRHLGTAVAAILVLTLSVDNWFLRQRLNTLDSNIAHHQGHPEDYTFNLKGTPAATTASATVVVDVDTGQVLLGVQNLPPLPEGEAYHLWAYTRDRSQILCGRFNTNSVGQLVEHFSVDPAIYTDDVEFMRISKEPATTPPDDSRRVLVLTSES